MVNRSAYAVSRHESIELLTLAEVSHNLGLRMQEIERFIELGLIEFEQDNPELLFQAAVIPQIKKMLRIRNDLRINLNGVGVVLDLLDRVSELEEAIAFYQRKDEGRGW